MGSTLDTSGYVMCPGERPTDQAFTVFKHWSDLDAFTQGYVAALFESVVADPDFNAEYPGFFSASIPASFCDLSPDALSAILRDCGSVREQAEFFADDPGASFWLNRQSAWPSWRDRPELPSRFPPVVPCVEDDGKIHLRPRSEATITGETSGSGISTKGSPS